MNVTPTQTLVLLLIALLGHLMAFIWYVAWKKGWKISRTRIYDIDIPARQLQREAMNSLHAPIHAVILLGFLQFAQFQNESMTSFVATGLGVTVWAEVWHYFSHRAFHLKPLHWIHVEHHRSHINSPLTAISFSFWEKLFFDLGLLLPLAAVDQLVSLNFYGIAAWYVGYLVINSFSHANFEFRGTGYIGHVGRFLTTTTYHSLHHSRYTGNYGLGTRFLDRLFGTEWEDYEPLYAQITNAHKPLRRLREKAGEDSE
ncbi:MAG: sterol desaturase family protein [Rhizobiaceae bacterium]